MTREDVKKQLAKSPLVWDDSSVELVAYVATLDIWAKIEYTIDGGSLFIKASVPDDSFQEFITGREDVDCLKSVAEGHRLDLICEMLGITE